MEIVDLLREGARLKMELSVKKDRLAEINRALAEAAEFKDGSQTGHLVAGGIRAKVQLRQNVRWDQERLKELGKHCPEPFGRAFKSKLEPASAKALQEAMAMDADFAAGVEWARTVSAGAPQVDYEVLLDAAGAGEVAAAPAGAKGRGGRGTAGTPASAETAGAAEVAHAA